MIFKWKTEFPAHGVDAQVAGERLERIRKKKALTPKAIVEDARQKESPLHPCFEWNNAVAAEKFREDQARCIMHNLVVEVEGHGEGNVEVRAFVNVTVGEHREYTSIGAALGDEGLRKQVLDSALREIDSWRKRYKDLKELSEVLAAADRAVASLANKDSAEVRETAFRAS